MRRPCGRESTIVHAFQEVLSNDEGMNLQWYVIKADK